MKNGLIFSQQGEPLVEVDVATNLGRLRLTVRFLKNLGRGLVVGGVGVFLLFYWPVILEEAKYAFGQTILGKGIVRIENTQPVFVSESIPGKTQTEKPNWKVPDMGYSIYIPKILAKSKVVSDVDPIDKKSYGAALKVGVAEAKGLAHPGVVGTTYLFAHSVGSSLDFIRYNAIFYLLHKLSIGDGVEIVYRGELHKYEIYDKQIIDGDDMTYLVPQEKEERVVLQTCYPPGTAWKRLIILAKPVSINRG